MMKTAQFHWPAGQKCAISLTYDDGLPIHHQYVAPSLESAGLRGTFFALVNSDPLRHPEPWRQLAARGHELGNHTLFHPCRLAPERKWVESHYDLSTYTPKRLRTELQIANLVLHLLDGRDERTFGNVCCDTTFGSGEQETSMDAILRELFVAARGPFTERFADVRNGVDLMRVGHFGGDAVNMSYKDIQGVIEKAAAVGGWAVFMIHGVGEGTHDMYMEKPTHEQLLKWLSVNQADVWTAPFIEVAKHVKAHAPCRES